MQTHDEYMRDCEIHYFALMLMKYQNDPGGITQLVKEAGMTRATYYLRFNKVKDEVHALIRDRARKQ